MSELGKIHAAALNTMARIFGVMAVIAGVIFTIWGLAIVFDPNATFDVDGVPSNDPWIKAMPLVAGIVALVMGVLMLLARPYRPEE
ncbi:MAG: hypothetical protein P4N60_09880 [Verrucomicrobiae bacterium]|nr:hypothetical protein [Verrucomicrobiae bacterium]